MGDRGDIRGVERLAFIGFGEAAQAFLEGLTLGPAIGRAGFDLKLAAAEVQVRDGKAAEFRRFGVRAAADAAAAARDADLIFSLVTADQARSAAKQVAPGIRPGTLYLDGNSVSPEAKRWAAALIDSAGGRYVDMAIMAPVRPALQRAPLLMGGPHAAAGAAAARALGFRHVRLIEGPVGSAAAVKMIRSIMIKGLEALTAECLLAADAAGVRDEVLASFAAGGQAPPWADGGDYALDRMLVHGQRRAEEMREVAATVEALGLDAAMSRATARWQAAIGALACQAPPMGPAAKIQLIREARRSK